MTLAQSSNATDVYVAPQANAGEVGTPVFDKFNSTSGRLNKTVAYVKSSTIKTDGQATRNIRDSVTLNSEIAFELDKGIVNIMRSALRVNGPTPLVTVSGSTIAADSTAHTITDSADGFANINANSFVFVTGFANAALNKEYFVVSKTDGVLTMLDNTVPADEAAGETVTVTQRSMLSGKTPNNLVVQERETTDGATLYATQIDAIVNTLNITVPTTGVVTCNIGIVAGSQLNQTTPVSGQTDNPVVDLQPVSNLDMVWMPDQEPIVDYKFTDVTMDITSNSEAIQGAGVEGAICNTINTIGVTGNLNSITTISQPREELAKQQNGVEFSISYKFNFDDGNAMIITMKRVRYTEGSRERSTDTVANFSGTYDAETEQDGVTIQADFSY